MAPAGKASNFYKEGNDWYCSTSLPSDITISVGDINFHLHKFPLISKCGKVARLCQESQSVTDEKIFKAVFEEFPGGPDTFFLVVKFCYGSRLELTPRNLALIYCAADYLEMTDEYEEDNLFSKSESYLHKTILRSWKDCILALQNSEPVMPKAEKLHLISRCLNSLSMMVCTDPSLFGWPMKMYGSLQSPGGSILWNGINTGARIHSSETDWWFEDISYLSVNLFEKLVKAMEERGIRPENLLGAVMYYARKYLPGLGRWQGRLSGKRRTVTSFSLTPASVDQRVLLESVEKLLPQRKKKSFCRFLLGLLRVALILGMDKKCMDSLERRIGLQLEMATLDGLLIPTYSESDTLYNTDCVERIVHHFTCSEPLSLKSLSPESLDLEVSPSSGPMRKVGRLIDSYIAEVASDMNLKPGKLRSLMEAIPESSRPLHDGLYRALDIYFKAHPWLSQIEREELCNLIDYGKLSIDACAHASENDRLPLRVVLQVLFFEQIQLRKALAGCLHILDTENVPVGSLAGPSEMGPQITQRDGWVSIVRENQVLRVDMENIRSRVRELEQEFNGIKEEMKRVSKSNSSLTSPRLIARRIGCKLLPSGSDAKPDVLESAGPTPRASVEQAHSNPHQLKHRKSFSLI